MTRRSVWSFPEEHRMLLYDRILENNDPKCYHAVIFNEVDLKESENYKPYIKME